MTESLKSILGVGLWIVGSYATMMILVLSFIVLSLNRSKNTIASPASVARVKRVDRLRAFLLILVLIGVLTHIYYNYYSATH